MDYLTDKNPNEDENPAMLNLVEKFYLSLGRLFIYNQSNWRYLMEWSYHMGNKIGLNIPSVILQYLEYQRITSNSSRDYEDKI